MNRKTYHKLVRDNIPEIIKKDNAVAKIRVLNDEQFKRALKEKLVEEVLGVFRKTDLSKH